MIRKFSDPPLETCPKCGSHVHKLISAPAFQFKGSGWYITDYAKKDSSPASKAAETSTKDETSKKDESKKDESKDATPAKTEPTPAKSDTPTKKAD
jgi:predicted nucleic acid-binding Zn ribbon protein